MPCEVRSIGLYNYAKNTAHHIHIRTADQFKQDKNDRNEINSCRGPSRLVMHLCNHIPFGIAAVGTVFIFQDDNA